MNRRFIQLRSELRKRNKLHTGREKATFRTEAADPALHTHPHPPTHTPTHTEKCLDKSPKRIFANSTQIHH